MFRTFIPRIAAPSDFREGGEESASSSLLRILNEKGLRLERTGEQ